MSREIARLDHQDAQSFKRFLVAEPSIGPLVFQDMMLEQFFLKDPNGLALAIIDRDRIEQLYMFSFIDNKYCASRGAYGQLDSASIEIFNLLCSICSSRTPEITCHELIYPVEQSQQIVEYFNKSRLGYFIESSSEQLIKRFMRPSDDALFTRCFGKRIPKRDTIVTSVKIKYPSAN